MNLKVVCVKWGKKYSADYANRLFNMVERNLTLPHEFICLTDNPRGLNPNIKTRKLLEGFKGWWSKLELFKPGVFTETDLCLYFDLDIVIAGNIDELATFRADDDFLSIFDWNRKNPQFNSSVMRFYGNQVSSPHNLLTTKLADGSAKWRQKRRFCRIFHFGGKILEADGRIFTGDQEWISHCLYPPEELKLHAFPDDWILSHKKYGRNDLPAGCKIMVFHGQPKPHEVDNDYVRDNWR